MPQLDLTTAFHHYVAFIISFSAIIVLLVWAVMPKLHTILLLRNKTTNDVIYSLNLLDSISFEPEDFSVSSRIVQLAQYSIFFNDYAQVHALVAVPGILNERFVIRVGDLFYYS